MDRGDRDWEEFGAREPYFSVLTDDRFLCDQISSRSLEAFFATGERDVEMLMELAARERAGPVTPKNTLDFGCGVGRLTIPLARRSSRVLAVDVAQSMLARAAESVARTGLQNVELLLVERLSTLDAGAFDLVCSYLVFQHIPVKAGEAHLRTLLDLTAPDGQVVLHFTFRRAGSRVRRLLRELRGRAPLVHAIARLVRRERKLPYLQMNEYDEGRVRKMLEEHGFRRPTMAATNHGGITGAILIATKTS